MWRLIVTLNANRIGSDSFLNAAMISRPPARARERASCDWERACAVRDHDPIVRARRLRSSVGWTLFSLLLCRRRHLRERNRVSLLYIQYYAGSLARTDCNCAIVPGGVHCSTCKHIRAKVWIFFENFQRAKWLREVMRRDKRANGFFATVRAREQIGTQTHSSGVNYVPEYYL